MANFEKVYSIGFNTTKALRSLEKFEKKYKALDARINKAFSGKGGRAGGFEKRVIKITRLFDKLGNSAEKNLRKVRTGFTGAKRAATDFERSMSRSKSGAAFKNAKSQIDRATKSLKKMQASGNKAFTSMRKGSGRAAAGIRRIDKASKGASVSIKGLIVKIGLFIGAAQGIRNIVSSFMDFDRSMTLAGAKFSALDKQMQPGTRAFADFRKEIRAAAVDTEHTAAAVAGAVDFWAKAGKTAAQTKAVIPVTLDFASANTDASGAALDMARAGDILSDALGQFQLSSDDPSELMANTARVSDVMSAAANSANVSAEELFESFKQAGPVLTAVGGDIEATSALLSVMADAGIKGSLAGTQLKIAVTSLAAATGPQTELLEQLNVKIKDSGGDMRTLTDIIGDLDKATENMGSGDRFEVFAKLLGRRGVPGFLNLVAKGNLNIDALSEKLRNASGETKRLAEIIRKSASAQMSKFWNQLTNIGFTLIEETQLFDKLGKVLADIDWKGVSNFITQRFIPALAAIGTTFTRYILPVLGVFSDAIGAVLLPAIDLMTIAFNMAGASGENFGAALDDIVRKIPQITADGIKLLSREFSAFIFLVERSVGKAKQLFTGLSTSIIANWGPVEETFLSTASVVGESYKALFDDLKELVYEIVTIFVGGSDDVEADWTEMGMRLGVIFSTLATTISTVLSVVARVSSAVFGSVLNVVTTVVSSIKTVFSQGFAGILSIMEGNFLEGFKRIGAALFNALTMPIRAAITGVIRLIQGIPGADDLAKSLGINLDEVSQYVKEGITFDEDAGKMQAPAVPKVGKAIEAQSDIGGIPDVTGMVGKSIDTTAMNVPDMFSDQSFGAELSSEIDKLNANIETLRPSEQGILATPMIEGQAELLKFHENTAAKTDAFQSKMLEATAGKAAMAAPQVNVRVDGSNITIQANGVDAAEVGRIVRRGQNDAARQTSSIIKNATKGITFGEQ